MSKPAKNERIPARFFTWMLCQRKGIWYADGRSNSPNPGRHSLGTTDRKEALKLIHTELDLKLGVKHKLAPQELLLRVGEKPLELAHGRELYDAHCKRPRVIGGLKLSSQRKYKYQLDQFMKFCIRNGIQTWNDVTRQTLQDYAAYLHDKMNHEPNTVGNVLTTLKQVQNFLINEGRLNPTLKVHLKVRRFDGKRRYCYSTPEYVAMIRHCQTVPDLTWLHNLIIGFGNTGLRAEELAELTWSNLDLPKGMICLRDETSRPGNVTSGVELKSSVSRMFPIAPAMRTLLENLPKRNGHVFLGQDGKKIKPKIARDIFAEQVILPLSKTSVVTDKVQFLTARFHSFRHFFISSCASNGVPIQMLMAWVGHKNSEMIRHYYHLNDTDSLRNIQRLKFLEDLSATESTNPDATVQPTVAKLADPANVPDNKV